MPIYIGAIFGGPEAERSEIFRIWSELSTALEHLQDSFVKKDDGELDLVFHVPGSLSKVRFEGIRTGSFSKKERIVQIQIAVPQSIVDSPSLRRFLIDSLRQGITIGKHYLAKKRIPFSEEAHLNLLKEIESSILPEPPE